MVCRILFENDRNSVLGELNIRKTELNVKAIKTTRYVLSPVMEDRKTDLKMKSEKAKEVD